MWKWEPMLNIGLGEQQSPYVSWQCRRALLRPIWEKEQVVQSLFKTRDKVQQGKFGKAQGSFVVVWIPHEKDQMRETNWAKGFMPLKEQRSDKKARLSMAVRPTCEIKQHGGKIVYPVPSYHEFWTETVPEEIADYLKDDESDRAKLWSQTKRMNTRLGELARRTFCVPATSASSERVFSKSGILMSPLRSRMSSKTLEMRTFLKSNYGFVDNPAPVAKTVEISSKQ